MALTAALAVVAGLLLIPKAPEKRPLLTAAKASSQPAPAPASKPEAAVAAEPAPELLISKSEPANASIQTLSPTSTPNTSANYKGTGNPKPLLQDPLARVALTLVGADPQAEAYWAEAINDPSLSAHERQDLIEDLNEDGLSDPDHPQMEDLPLIINRLQIIDALGPYAMDEVNADAFDEARKDLVNMFQQLTGTAWPL